MNELDPLEDMMDQLGELGRYQMFQHFLHVFGSFFAGLHMLSLTFTTPEPKHRCRIDEIDGIKDQLDSDYNFNETENKDLFKESKIKDYIPKNGIHFSQCERKMKSGGKTTCNRYVYEFDVYHPTSYVVRYNMVCKDEYKRPLMKAIYIFGVLIGCIVLGPLGDKVGRKPILCISAWLQVIFAIGSAFVTNYLLHFIVLFTYGAFASGGAYVTGFVLSMELVGARRRNLCGTNFSMMFTIGCLLLVATAFFEHNANRLQVILGIYSLVMAGHWWLCDESIRWLWSTGNRNNRKEAIRLAKKAARWNNMDFIDRYSYSVEEPASGNDTIPETLNGLDKEPRGLFRLLQYRVLRLRILLLGFLWFAHSMVYFGVGYRAGDISQTGNLYLNFFLGSLTEFPGFIIVNFGVRYTGNLIMIIVGLGISGIMCYICLTLDSDATVITFSIFAGMAVSMSFAVTYNYTVDLFPTVALSGAVGFLSSAARLAGTSTHMLPLLNESYANIAVLIIGSMAIVGAMICFFLPETLETKLPMRMVDGEKFKIDDPACNMCRPKRIGIEEPEESIYPLPTITPSWISTKPN